MFFQKSKSINNPKNIPEENKNLHEIIRAVTEINQAMVGVLDSTKVVQLITNSLVSVINVSFADVFVWDEDQQALILKSITIPKAVSILAEKALGKPLTTFALYKSNPEHLKNDYMRCFFEGKVRKVESLYNLSYPMIDEKTSNILQSLVGMKLAIALPLQIRDKVIGVLGVIWKNDSISEEEDSVLKTFANQISTTLYNAELFKQSQDQVNQLTTKNQDLDSLYTLTTQVSQTLVPKVVAQTAVDALPQTKSMVGSIITFYDDEKKKLIPIAVTKNSLSDKVKELIGDFEKYEIDVLDPKFTNNITARALKENRIIHTTKLEDFLSPPVPSQFISIIEKLIDIKSVVVFPLHSREKVIGTITYLLKEKDYDELGVNEKQLFATYTYQISSALDNSMLYQNSQIISQNLEKALKQVQEARTHEQDMIDILGHELRTPATVCKGNLELLKSKVHTTEDISQEATREYLTNRINSAYASIVQETGLINELLTATKLDSGQLVITSEPIDMYELAKNNYQNYLQITSKRKDLELVFVEPSQKIPLTLGDKVRMGEVIDNLISNSVKYTKEGKISLSVVSDNETISFSIKDTGNGIPKDELPKLFQKFKRVNNYIKASNEIVRPGVTGLGLYVSKGIIEAHGGTIWAESDGEGKGSTFTFSIPIHQLQGNISDKSNEVEMFKKLGLIKK